MQSSFLNFITENNHLINFFVASIAGVFVVIKWLDTRNRELQEKRYAKYMDLIAIISGNHPNGKHSKMTEQIAVVWFLMEYKEYNHITRKIFNSTDLDSIGNDEWKTHLVPQIKLLLKEI